MLRGEKSLVALPIDFRRSDAYKEHDMRHRFGVYSIRPGITGLAQIHGRDRMSPAESLMEARYLEEFSLKTDMKILLDTAPDAARSGGVTEGFDSAASGQSPWDADQPIPVTILTVVRNSENTISRAMESVLNQTYPDMEYIVLDGASTDRTVEIAESYIPLFREKGKCLRVISEPDNGMYDALNKGIRMAEGYLVGNINADDWYEPYAVERMVEFYREKPYDIAWADLVIEKPSGNMIKRARNGKLWVTSGFCHPTMFATRDILLEFPYACRQMDDDFDMVTRVRNAGKRICVLNEVLAHYSFGGMSTSKSLKKSAQRIRMKWETYRRNGFSVFYWFYCVAIEAAKYILG